MSLPNYFHEAHRALEGIRHEFTAVGSVNATAIFGVPHACELALRGLYAAATNTRFPQDRYRPHHQPEALARRLGVADFYSEQSMVFLRDLTGRALSDARYPGSDAHDKYTHATSGELSYHLIEQADQFLRETEALATSAAALSAVRAESSK